MAGAFLGAGLSDSEEESLSDELSFFAGAFLAGAAAFLGAGLSDSDDSLSELLSFLATFLAATGAFF